MKSAVSAAVVAMLAGSAMGQVVINEVYENPPGAAAGNDDVLEYIEFFGEPGMDLTGYAIGQFKGGEDIDGNDIAEVPAEIDEAFSLDGLSLDSRGYLVLYNGEPNNSLIPLFLPAGANAASFFDQHIPSSDTNGNLNNDGSSTYLLIRARPDYAVVGGVSVYGPAYNMAKETNPDFNFDGKIDFGNECPACLPVQPLQIIDEFAWSNSGGKEYVSDSEFEISDTAGFNPDAVSRVNYFGANPMLGLRVNGDGLTVPTRIADEELVYGDIATTFDFNPARSGAPTDPNGDGFQDLSTAGFALTPGDANTGGNFTQFQFTRGDFNFDAVVDAADGSLIAARLGEDLDVTAPCVDDMGDPIIVNGTQPDCFVYQGRSANALLAMMNMDKNDAIGGGNADFVTQADIDAWNDEFAGGCNAADLAAPLGQLTFADISAFLAAFTTQDPAADLAAPAGQFTFADISAFLAAFSAGCP
jgi:hypothetical protein